MGGQGKLPYFMYFPWLPIEAALVMFNVSFFVQKTISEKELIKKRRFPSMSNHNLS
jgi:hypothetical protein